MRKKRKVRPKTREIPRLIRLINQAESFEEKLRIAGNAGHIPKDWPTAVAFAWSTLRWVAENPKFTAEHKKWYRQEIVEPGTLRFFIDVMQRGDARMLRKLAKAVEISQAKHFESRYAIMALLWEGRHNSPVNVTEIHNKWPQESLRSLQRYAQQLNIPTIGQGHPTMRK